MSSNHLRSRCPHQHKSRSVITITRCGTPTLQHRTHRITAFSRHEKCSMFRIVPAHMSLHAFSSPTSLSTAHRESSEAIRLARHTFPVRRITAICASVWRFAGMTYILVLTSGQSSCSKDCTTCRSISFGQILFGHVVWALLFAQRKQCPSQASTELSVRQMAIPWVKIHQSFKTFTSQRPNPSAK